MFSMFLLAATTAAAVADAAAVPTTPLGTLYAYGSGISGLPLIYSDGSAILGWGVPTFATTATNLSFTYTDTSLLAEPNSTTLATDWTTRYLCINANPGQQAQIQFAMSENETFTTTGWEFYGRQLLWDGTKANSTIGAGRSFWASPMDALDGGSGFYKLVWNADNSVLNNSVPVTVKRLPPPLFA